MATHTIDELCTDLGVPRRDWPLFARWADDVANPATTDALNSYVDVLVAERCAHPTGDLMSWFISLEFDDAGLTADEIAQFVAALLAAISAGRRAHTVGDDWTRSPAP